MKKVLFLGLVLALVAILVVPVVAFAAVDPNDTEIIGTVPDPSITVTAPSGIDLDTLTPPGPCNVWSVTPGTVIVVNATTWHVDAAADPWYTGGYMWNGAGDTHLTNEFQISSGDVWHGASTGFTYGGSPTSLPFEVCQAINTTEPAGAFSIVIVFTGMIDS